MTNIKIRKGYFHRFQTKRRRRREGKTNYTRRRKMVRHNLKNYGAVKTRMVVRHTNTRIICQLVKAYESGDRTIAVACSSELKKYGLSVGLTNYSAAYATGLLCARKALRQTQTGSKDSKETDSKDNKETCMSHKAVLDIGLGRSTRGSRYYACLKGAVDGGLHIPHSPKIFPGYAPDTDAHVQALHDRIHGKTVATYMAMLRETDNDKYHRMFSRYIKAGIGPEHLEQMYKDVYEKVLSY